MFKNWKMICQIVDVHFMWAMALLDLTTDFGRLVIERFPEYFSKELQTGPIPKSVIQTWTRMKNHGCDDAPVTYGVMKNFNVPLFKFEGSDISAEMKLWLEGHSSCQWKGFEWEGKKLVCIEDEWHDGNDWVFFVPAELIALDK